MMDTRRKILIGFVLFAAGVGGGIFARPYIVGWFEAAAPVSVADDAGSLLPLVAPDARLPGDLRDDPESFQGFWDTWDRRRTRYTPEQLADLRRRLVTYLDFMQAEYGDAAEIWRHGRPEHVREHSTAVRELRVRIRQALGDELADKLVKEADEMREHAYLSSPRVAEGDDETTTNYADMYEDLIRGWLPKAQLRVEQLTAPVAPK